MSGREKASGAPADLAVRASSTHEAGAAGVLPEVALELEQLATELAAQRSAAEAEGDGGSALELSLRMLNALVRPRPSASGAETADGGRERRHPVASALTALLPAFSDDELALYQSGLSALVAHRTPAERAWGEFGLLATIQLDNADGTVVPTARYLVVRDFAKKHFGEEWDDPDTLSRRAGGDWAKANVHTMRVVVEGNKDRLSSDERYRNRRPMLSLTRLEAVEAQRLAFAALGFWPSKWEYDIYARFVALAIDLYDSKRTSARPPSLGALERPWRGHGGWTAAMVEAQRLELGGAAQSS